MTDAATPPDGHLARKTLCADEAAVLDSMRAVGGRAKPAATVGRIILVVALEPHDLAIALEGQNVRGDTVEKPAVVADDHDTAGKLQQGVFERTQGVDVEVVRRLVEQQHVGAGLEQRGEMHTVPLAARQLAHLPLLVPPLEVEPGAVGA